MSSIHQQLLERNARETTPFVPVYEAYSYLQQQVDALQNKLDDSDQEVAALRQQVHDRCDTSTNNKGPLQKSKSNIAMQSALKNETRLRDKLELLQEEYNTKLKVESDVQADALKTAKRLLEVQALCDSNEKTIVSLKQQVDRGIDAVDRLQLQVQDAESRTLLAEQQYDGLKTTVRSLQEENDALSKENRMFEGRIVSDKEKEADEMNKLTEMIEKLQNEVVMLRTLKQHEDQRKSTSSSTKSSWFGGSSHKDSVANAIAGSTTLLTKDETTPTRKFGDFGVVVVPTTPKQTIATAHAMEITFVKYEASGSSSNLLVTGSSDSTVKLWDSTNGSLRSTFRGSPGHSIMCGDFSGNVVVGGGSDKTCRVWNIRTERMVRMHCVMSHSIVLF